MKIAVASQNQKIISGHAGRVSKFYIYIIDKETQEIKNREQITLAKEDILHIRFHESQDPWAPHPIFEVDILITGGAGSGFVNRLANKSTQVIITSETDPDEAVTQFLAGTLPQQEPEQHHHHH